MTWAYHLLVRSGEGDGTRPALATSVERSSGWSKTLTRLTRRLRDERGVVMLEYAILVGVIGISASVAFVGLGVAFVRNFAFVRGLLLTPFP